MIRLSGSVWTVLAFLGATTTPALANEAVWVEVRSPHFSVVTDAGERRGRETVLRFEQMRAAFGALMNKAKVSLPVPLQIVAFRNTKEMRQFVPIWKGKPVELAGLFQGGEDRCFILLDMSVENPWSVVFHEYAHQLLNGNLSFRVHPWFDEGFAEFFSTVETTGKGANVGKVPENSYYTLQHGFMKVSDLLRVEQQSSTYNESSDHRSLFYAESWLVVHYLYDKGLLPKLAAYFNLALTPGADMDQALQQAFGISAAAFEKAIKQYLNDNRFQYFIVPMPPDIESKRYAVRRVAEADVKAVLADVHLHSADHQQQAIGEFEQVLKLEPDNPSALRGLGYAYLMKQDYERAGEYFARAAKNETTDARLLYYSAVLAQRKGWDPEQLTVVEHQLEKAISLDPGFADAYNILAFTYLSQGKPDQALSSMLKAVELSPRNDIYTFNLAGIYLAARKFDDAIRLLTPLSTAADAATALRATNELAIARNAQQAETNAQSRFRGGSPAPAETGLPFVPSGYVPPIEPQSGIVKPVPTRFLKGQLVAVDCSPAPSAFLSVTSGSKTWKFRAADSKHLIVIGADEFSCAWANQKVAVNYRETGENSGDLVSLELQ